MCWHCFSYRFIEAALKKPEYIWPVEICSFVHQNDATWEIYCLWQYEKCGSCRWKMVLRQKRYPGNRSSSRKIAASKKQLEKTINSEGYVSMRAYMPSLGLRRKSYVDGKLGLWPFLHIVPAQRSSRKRFAGILQIKPLTINGEMCR